MAFILRLLFSLSTEALTFMTHRLFLCLFATIGHLYGIKKGGERGEVSKLRMFGCLAQLEIFLSLVLQSFNLIIQTTNHPAMVKHYEVA